MLRSPSDDNYKDPGKAPKSPGLLMLEDPYDDIDTFMEAKKKRRELLRHLRETREKEDKRRRSACEDGSSCGLQLRF